MVACCACRYWIQVVHDIEYGYGDPLRCKARPLHMLLHFFLSAPSSRVSLCQEATEG
jgi:hypothetical protein